MNGRTRMLDGLRRTGGKRLAQICAGLALAVLVGGLSGQMAAKPALAYACTDYGWQYEVTKVIGSQPYRLGTTHKSYNGTATSASLELSSSATGSVGVTVSGGATFNANAIFAGAQLTTSIALEVKYSWTVVQKMTITVPPHRWGNGIYGPLLWETYGHYYYLSPTCAISHSQYFYTYVPQNSDGWYTWISTT
jgi:hypothetical protein